MLLLVAQHISYKILCFCNFKSVKVCEGACMTKLLRYIFLWQLIGLWKKDKHYWPPTLNLNLSPLSLLPRGPGQVPPSPAGRGLRAPGRRGSESHASISGTCCSVWRTRDFPVTPISSTRAFSNRLDVRGERREPLVERSNAPSTQRDSF